MRYFNPSNVPFWDKTNQNLLMLADQLLSSLEYVPSFVVTSTFRTPEHNKEVGGVSDSYHLIGAAMDVQFTPYLALPKWAGLKIINYPIKGYSHIQLPERPEDETVGTMEVGVSESYPSLSIAPLTGMILGFLTVALIFLLILKK